MRIKTLATKTDLKEEQDEIVKLQTYDLLEKYNTIWDKISADIKNKNLIASLSIIKMFWKPK